MRDSRGILRKKPSLLLLLWERQIKNGVSSAQTPSSSPPEREREREKGQVLTRLYTFAKNDWNTSLLSPSRDPSAGISSMRAFRRAYESASYCSNSRARSSSR